MKKILVIAPHPDDETLGCGGTILRHQANGDNVSWLIVTGISVNCGYSQDRVKLRNKEIDKVAQLYKFTSVHRTDFPTTKLDTLSMGEIIGKISVIITTLSPEIIYLPYSGDVHTDHKVVFDAVISCAKWFRYSSVKRILCYETLSETEFGIDPALGTFRPNVYVDISDYFKQKLAIMNVYNSEIGDFPFPRSEKALEALGQLRGASAGVEYAEAFMLLKEIL